MLYLTLETVLSGAGPSAVYPRTVDVLQPVQTAAIMEVLHCMVGIVRSGVVTTAVQVASRLGILWGVLYTTPEVQGNPAIVSLLAAWALTEPIRYSFYTFQLLKLPVPAPLLWIRYSLFIIAYPVRARNQTQRASACLPAHRQLCVRACMYALRTPHAAARADTRTSRRTRATAWRPTANIRTHDALMQVGITSEVVLAVSALPHIRAAVAATGMLSVSLPNAWNFGFDFYWAAVVATMLYVPGAPFLYVRGASGLGPLTLRASASVFAMRCPAPRDSAPSPPAHQHTARAPR